MSEGKWRDFLDELLNMHKSNYEEVDEVQDRLELLDVLVSAKVNALEKQCKEWPVIYDEPLQANIKLLKALGVDTTSY